MLMGLPGPGTETGISGAPVSGKSSRPQTGAATLLAHLSICYDDC